MTKILFVVLLLGLVVSSAASDKIKIKDVQAITLKKNQLTRARRVAAIPQLQCRGRLCQYAAETAQCKNAGSDGISTQWDCIAEFPDTIRFNNIEVSCEGYEYAEDPYILKGSCALMYTLKGEIPNDDRRPARLNKGVSGLGGIILFGIILLLCSGNCNGRGGYRTTGCDGPGFWSGLGLGTLAGTAYSRRGARRRYSGGWGGGWGSGRRSSGGGGRSISRAFGGTVGR